MDLLQHTLYINLEHRTDRREHLETQLQKLGIRADRVDAVSHEFGAVGCFASHLKCLEIAREHDWPYVCILEDDADFTNPELFRQQLEQFHAEEKEPWDVLFLAANVGQSTPHAPYCRRAVDVQTATAYIVQRHYYKTLLKHLYKGYKELEREPKRRHAYAYDIYWKTLQKTDRWLILTPLTINQKPGFSDIEKRNVNYSHCMLEKLKHVRD